MVEKIDYIAEAITDSLGERCAEPSKGCPTCEAWAQYDALTTCAMIREAFANERALEATPSPITKEAIEAGYAAAQVRDIRDERSHKERFVDGLTAAFSAMPGPAVKLDRLRAILRELWAACDMDLKMCDGTIKTGQFGILQDIREDLGLLLSTVALTPAPDLASENERLRAALKSAEAEFNTISCEGVTETRSLHDAFDRAKMFADRAAALAAAEERGRSEERERWLPDVEFLLDRLYDINLDDDTDDLIRDWNGHVEPAIARLRAITKEPTP